MWQSLTNQYPGGELPPARPPRDVGPRIPPPNPRVGLYLGKGAGQGVKLAGQIPGGEGGSDPGEASLRLFWVKTLPEPGSLRRAQSDRAGGAPHPPACRTWDPKGTGILGGGDGLIRRDF